MIFVEIENSQIFKRARLELCATLKSIYGIINNYKLLKSIVVICSDMVVYRFIFDL